MFIIYYLIKKENIRTLQILMASIILGFLMFFVYLFIPWPLVGFSGIFYIFYGILLI